jgi:hypothetical protein
MRFRAAALILRIGFAAAFWTPTVFFSAAAGFSAMRYAAHRFRCAAAMRFRPAALIVRFFGAGRAPSELPTAARTALPPSCRRNSAILVSISTRCCSYPTSAAFNNSGSCKDPLLKLRRLYAIAQHYMPMHASAGQSIRPLSYSPGRVSMRAVSLSLFHALWTEIDAMMTMT